MHVTERSMFHEAKSALISIAALTLTLGCSGPSAGVNPIPTPPASAAVVPAPPGAGAAGPAGSGSPIDGALPSAAPAPLVDRADCASGMTCTRSHIVPDEMLRGLSARGAVAMWEESIAGDAEVIFPADKGVEIVGVVLDGGIDVLPQEKELVDRPLGQRWMGFRAPGGGVGLTPLKGKRAR